MSWGSLSFQLGLWVGRGLTVPVTRGYRHSAGTKVYCMVLEELWKAFSQNAGGKKGFSRKYGQLIDLRNWRASWWKWKRRIKSRLKAQHSENDYHGIWSRHFMGNRWGNSGNSQTLFFWAPKSLQMVIAAMKLKDAYSSEEKLCLCFWICYLGWS